MNVASWTCPKGHTTAFDGGNDGLFSTNKADTFGRVMIFSRSFCDALVSFIYNSRSSYAAATAFLASLRSDFGLNRQTIVLLGRCFVACLQPAAEVFVCPKCGEDPAYIVIDGQSLGFRMREGINLVRPALHLPNLNLDVNKYAVLLQPSMRAAIRKVLRSGDALNKTDIAALGRLADTRMSVRPRSRTAATIANWQLARYAADAFLFFHHWTPDEDAAAAARSALGGTDPERTGGAGAAASEGGVGAAGAASSPVTTAGAAAADDPSPCTDGQGGIKAVAAPAVPWHERTGPARPRLNLFGAGAARTEWAAVRPFLLAMLGDPVVNLFQGHRTAPVVELAREMQKEDGGKWVKCAKAANAAGFVANFFARLMPLLKEHPLLRVCIGYLLLFAAEVDAVVDADFQAAARKAALAGQTETEEFCRRWCCVSGPEEYNKFAAEHPNFKGKDVDSPYTSFEFFGFLRRVRPAIFTPRSKARRKTGQPRPRKGAQAEQEDAVDRCSKSFPKHSDLTAGVFNIVCPHVLTMGFRVMFQAESVADALSLILERFPKLPKVVFYDVACKMDRNGMQRVRTILSKHKVRFCLDRAHAKGHTCSCVYFPDESLSVTNGVSTQAAEVQHSISVKFRGHLAYMSPASFMAHRIVQLSYMNLTAAFKLQPDAKAENTGVRLNKFYFSFRAVKCLRPGCTCPAGTSSWLLTRNPPGADENASTAQDSSSDESNAGGQPATGGDHVGERDSGAFGERAGGIDDVVVGGGGGGDDGRGGDGGDGRGDGEVAGGMAAGGHVGSDEELDDWDSEWDSD